MKTVLALGILALLFLGFIFRWELKVVDRTPCKLDRWTGAVYWHVADDSGIYSWSQEVISSSKKSN
jgi:hypothetical protein